MKLKRRIILGFLIGITLINCQSSYIQIPLPLPGKPIFPAFSDEELSCLSGEVYYRVAVRDMRKDFYIERLEFIIKSTWEKE